MVIYFYLCQLEILPEQGIWEGLETLLCKPLRAVAGHLLPRDTEPFPLCFQDIRKYFPQPGSGLTLAVTGQFPFGALTSEPWLHRGALALWALLGTSP